MFTGDTEAIRQRMISLLVDSEDLKRKVGRIARGRNQAQNEALIVLKNIADRIDRETRELYHLLPEELRPTEMPRPLNPREPRPGGPDGRKHPGPTPGGVIPREVRWPNWTIEQVLALADAFHEKHKKWPNKNSGRISEASSDTWNGIDLALKRGNRNLPGGTTLARLLAAHRGVRHCACLPKLNIEQILAWADAHYASTEKWPTLHSGAVIGVPDESGAVIEAPDETWKGIDDALKHGNRGVKIKTSLARLLAERRGVSYPLNQEDLTIAQILAWADAHYARIGNWPTRTAGDIPDAPRENWGRIDHSLIQGNRSLSPGSSLARLLAEHRSVRNRKALPTFDIATLLLWADSHYERHGRWPSVWSGAIEDAPGETWAAVDAAFKAADPRLAERQKATAKEQSTTRTTLKTAGRGLAGCGYRSLAHLLEEQRGKLQRRGNRPAERVLPGVP